MRAEKSMPRGAVTSAVLKHLRASGSKWSSVQELVDVVYGDSEEGGPLWADTVIQVTMFRLRQRGLMIETHSRGRRALGYRLAEDA
jgi:hypothetical protein